MLSKVLAQRLILISLTVCMVFATLFSFNAYKEGLDKVRDAKSAVEAYAGPIADSLWYLDQNALESQLQVLDALPFVLEVRVEQEGRVIKQLGKSISPDAQTYSIPLIYHNDIKNKDEEIGELFTIIEEKTIFNVIKQDIYSIFLISLAQSLVIGIFCTLIADRLLGRHLRDLKSYVDTYDITSASQDRFKLDRDGSGDDELSAIVGSINSAQERFRQSLREVSELRRQETDLKEAAQQADKAKSAFLAMMSHEIRTPMTGVIGFADILLRSDLRAKDRHYIEKIKECSVGLLSVINDVLDVSKLDADRLEIEELDFSPTDIIAGVLKLFVETLPIEKRDAIEITPKIFSNVPETICSDPTRFRQILLNLVGNAVKFTQTGTICVECRLLEGGTTLKLAVIDTGIGIPEATLPHLFEDFRQADPSISRRYEGTGLGLSICRRLVDLMGGEIEVESTLGEGSTFSFTLPFKPATAEVKSAPQQPVMPEVQDGPLHILVVEDNDINQAIIVSMLSKLGHSYDVASDGAEGVNAVRQGDYDLVLMDIRMPVMSGIEATRQIRSFSSDARDIPIFAVTADVMAENKRSYVAAGINGCIAKPIDQNELARICRSISPRNRAPDAAAADTVVNASNAHETPVSEPGNGDAADINGVDLPKALHAVLGNKATLISLLVKFRDEYLDYGVRIRAFVDSGELKEAKALSHSLKGVSGSLYVNNVHAAAVQLDGAIANGAEKEDIYGLIHALEGELAQTKMTLTNIEGLSL